MFLVRLWVCVMQINDLTSAGIFSDAGRRASDAVVPCTVASGDTALSRCCFEFHELKLA